MRSCAAIASGKSKRSSAANPIIAPLLLLGKLKCLFGYIENINGWLAQCAHEAMRGHLYVLAFVGGIYGDAGCQWVAQCALAMTAWMPETMHPCANMSHL